MAETKFTGLLSEEREKGEYDSWVAGTHQKLVPLDSLHEHPDNWDLVGHIGAKKKGALKEDISRSGIREPLQVWFREGRLVVVSGHERLGIARELGLGELPCIKVEFASELEAKQHIYATNANRKRVSRPAEEVMEELFPPEKYPLLYEDLRGNFSEKIVGERSGILSPGEKSERETVEEKREAQAELRKKVGRTLGLTGETARKTVNRVAKKARKKAAKRTPEPNQLTAAQKKKTVALFRDLGAVRSSIGKKDELFKKLKTDLSELRKKEKRIGRELLKLGVVDDI